MMKTCSDTFEGLPVVVNNRQSWKWFGNCTGKWISIPSVITIKPGRTLVTLESVKLNGILLVQFKLTFLWKNASEEVPMDMDCGNELCSSKSQHRSQLSGGRIPNHKQLSGGIQHHSELCGGNPHHSQLSGSIPHRSQLSGGIPLSFTVCNRTGVLCNKAYLDCRERQKLVPGNIFIENIHEQGSFIDVKGEYEIKIQFSDTI